MLKSYHAATTYLCDEIEDLIVDGKFDFYDESFADGVMRYVGGVELGFGTKYDLSTCKAWPITYYSIEPHAGIFVADLATRIDEFFDFASKVCAVNLRNDKPLPPSLRIFAASVLEGNQRRPNKRARPRKKNWTERFTYWGLIIEAASRFGLDITRNDEGSRRYSACDALAEALTVCGKKTKYSEMSRLMTNPENARLRKEFEACMRIATRWKKRNPPKNALTDDYFEFWSRAAQEDAQDILATFPTSRGKST